MPPEYVEAGSSARCSSPTCSIASARGSARSRAAQTGETGEEHRVLARRQRGVDSDLLRHAADRGAYGALFRAQIVAGDPDLAGVVRQ